MRVIDLINTASEHLKEKGFENTRLEVERLLSSVLNLSRMNLYMNYDRPVGEEELVRFRSLYRRRLNKEPLQYILEKSGFREIEVKTDRRALIPRPETELLVQHAVDYLKRIKNPVIADLGTGTGVIALSIAYEIPDSKIVAADISSEALDLARYNAGLLGLEKSIKFLHCDMFDILREYGKFDAVISNPPYIESDIIGKLDEEVRDFEPRQALDGGYDGMDFLRRLAMDAHKSINPGGLLIMECGDEQAERLAGVFDGEIYTDIEIIKDYAGKQRIIKVIIK